MKTFQDFSPYNALKVQKTVSVQTSNCSKSFKRFQTMNKGLIKRNNRSFFFKKAENLGMFHQKP